MVWAHFRINHVFIFGTLLNAFLRCPWSTDPIPGLNVRTRLHTWEYFEVRSLAFCMAYDLFCSQIPAILFVSLCYSLWFSFAEVGSNIIKPEYYPLIWIALVVVIMINPLPWFARSSRYWFLKSAGRLLVPGLHHVEVGSFHLSSGYLFANIPR